MGETRQFKKIKRRGQVAPVLGETGKEARERGKIWREEGLSEENSKRLLGRVRCSR